ncbi:MAG: gliding motility-associated C-terminal domain-containing protein, partial [Saprospiraceae bacterium]|nr:gliding motility-associated C-terminal domain-containing protein [Saprospiraceae bacterium]
YFVTVTNASLFDTCVIVKQVKVIVPPVDLNLSVTNDTIICQGAITLSAQSSVNNVLYDWYNNEGTNIGGGSSITVTPTINSFYIVEATDQYGCTLSDTINAIKQNISLTDFDAVVCPHTNTTINVINNTPEINLVYSWTPASAIVQGATTANPTINVSANVELSYVATSALGCMQFGTIPVTINEIGGTIVANATPDTIQKGQSTQLSVNSNIDYTYNWAPISTLSNSQIANPVATPTETTTYNVFVTNSAGCIETSSVTVFVFNGLCEEPYIFVPNVFTPNDDSKNDILYVRGSAITSMTFMIYDRWGEKVFESKNISDGWDGKYKGKTLAPDVYGYYLKATCFEGNEFEKKGNITILK